MWKLLEMQNLSPQIRPTKSETWEVGWGVAECVFISPPGDRGTPGEPLPQGSRLTTLCTHTGPRQGGDSSLGCLLGFKFFFLS